MKWQSLKITWNGPRDAMFVFVGIFLGNPDLSNWWALIPLAVGLVSVQWETDT